MPMAKSMIEKLSAWSTSNSSNLSGQTFTTILETLKCIDCQRAASYLYFGLGLSGMYQFGFFLPKKLFAINKM